MENIKLASGDNVLTSLIKSDSLNTVLSESYDKIVDDKQDHENHSKNYAETLPINDIKENDENEIKLRQRIAQCKDIIASLKVELNEEKINMSIEVEKNKVTQLEQIGYYNELKSEKNNDLVKPNQYSVSVDSKLNCDENLLEYEKQLQRYKKALNMAQVEKKKAIRKRMLAKAFKLKLLEVENQCNIELLRVKQSLQCLEPLKLIMETWKTSNNDNVYHVNNFDWIPTNFELGTGSDVSSISDTEDVDT